MGPIPTDGVRVVLLEAPGNAMTTPPPCERVAVVGVAPVEVTVGGRTASDVVGWSLPNRGCGVTGQSDEIALTCPAAGSGASDQCWVPTMGRESNVDGFALCGHKVLSSGSSFTVQPA